MTKIDLNKAADWYEGYRSTRTVGLVETPQAKTKNGYRYYIGHFTHLYPSDITIYDNMISLSLEATLDAREFLRLLALELTFGDKTFKMSTIEAEHIVEYSRGREEMEESHRAAIVINYK